MPVNDPLNLAGNMRAPLTADESVQDAGGNPIDPLMQDDQLMVFDYERAKDAAKNINKPWEDEENLTQLRRDTRYLDVNLEALHASGDLAADETFIPIRVIDENIRKEQPPFIKYLMGRRLIIFACKSDPKENTEQLEREVTEGLRYIGWLNTPIKVVDGAQTHGWDSIKIEYDDTKELKIGFYHVGHENLRYQWDAKDVQACNRVLIRMKVTKDQLETFVKKYDFDRIQVDNLLREMRDEKKPLENIEIFEKLDKFDGIVYTSWISLSSECSGFLKAPQPLWMGRKEKTLETQIVNEPQQVIDPTSGAINVVEVPRPVQVEKWVELYETAFPIKILKYIESEQPAITDVKSRTFLDAPKQEAQTAGWTGFINGSNRASNVYGSPRNPSSAGSAIKKLDLNLEHGCFYSEPMDFWHTDYPPGDLLRALQSLDVRAKQEQGDVASAVLNREDSRKTATELGLAEQEGMELESIKVVMYSTFWHEVFAYAWEIIQNLALQGVVELLQEEVIDPLTGMPLGIRRNNMERLSKNYIAKPAGDIDVVERQQKLKTRMGLWPLVAATPLAMPYLFDILAEALPDDVKKYQQLYNQFVQISQQAPPMPGGGENSNGGQQPGNVAQLPQQQAAQ